MNKEEKLRNLSLKIIGVLVWFEILWAVVFVLALVFQWTFIASQVASAFFASGFAAALVLFAVTLLNFAANLHIISNAQLMKGSKGTEPDGKSNSLRIFGIAIGLIVIVVCSLWFAEWKLYQTKSEEARTKLVSISETKLVDEVFGLVEGDGTVKELIKVRDAIAESIQVGARLSVLIPSERRDFNVFYELSAWSYFKIETEEKLSEASLSRFIPRKHEKNKYEELKDEKITEFVLPDGQHLRAFLLIKRDGKRIILLLDTSRSLDYKRGSYR